MKKISKTPLLIILIGMTLLAVVLGTAATNETRGMAQEGDSHASLSLLEGPFEKPQEVTAACLTCHQDAAEQMMGTVHWTWEYTDPVTGQVLGKNNVINNYCIAIESNEPRCTSC
ncbi:MAG TPA: hypothetical protein VJ972_00825, partial [Anaerolineales bacterium]|nr:hypothetical protein [Anaerolineales bacterium]